MHPKLRLRLLRPAHRTGEVCQPELVIGDVEETSLPPVGLGERWAECLTSCDCNPAEAERLRMDYLKERGQ